MLKLRITHNALSEMDPMMDDVRSEIQSGNHEDDWGYGLLVEAIDAGRPVKGGLMVTLNHNAAVDALRNEADFREDHLLSRMGDAWDASEKMTLLGVALGFRAIVKKCDAFLASLD
jgi:hypothetical protein